MITIGIKAIMVKVSFHEAAKATIKPPIIVTMDETNNPSWGPVAWKNMQHMQINKRG